MLPEDITYLLFQYLFIIKPSNFEFFLSLSLSLYYSSNSSSSASLAGNSPKIASSDWAVPQSSRLKYRQKFNSLDKSMSGYLSGEYGICYGGGKPSVFSASGMLQAEGWNPSLGFDFHMK